MSLQAEASYRVPADTARVARAIFPDGNLVMRMYDEMGMLFQDTDFADLFPIQGQPAESPVRLALVTLLQFWEGLTDRQAADAVRTRIDWKYLLCLELTDPGFDHTVLSEFRSRLLSHNAERRVFDAILTLAQTRGLLKAGGRQRSDSTHVYLSIGNWLSGAFGEAESSPTRYNRSFLFPLPKALELIAPNVDGSPASLVVCLSFGLHFRD